MDCIIIRIVDMPLSIKGATVKDAEGDYNIYINARLGEDERVKTYWHEIDHIRLGHFYDERPVAEKEAEIKREPKSVSSGSQRALK